MTYREEVVVSVCLPQYKELAVPLFNTHCDSRHPLISITNPLSLQNWSLPVLELMVIAIAVVLLTHAVKRWRRAGDATNLAVWFTAVSMPIVVETVTYFPQWFGIYARNGLTFVHNQFTIQLFYDRFPLYIAGCYVTFIYLGYALVQRTGIFERYNVIVGAATVAFVTNCLYAPFDQVAPQLLWWVWNNAVPSGQPTIGVVPMLSVQIFNFAMPFTFSLLARLLFQRPESTGRDIARNICVLVLSTWPMIFAFALPALALQLLGVSPQSARSLVVWTTIVVTALVATTACAGAYFARGRDPSTTPDSVRGDLVPLATACAYFTLAVAAWIYALPKFLGAVGGVAENGGKTGSLAFAIGTFTFAVGFTVVAYLRTGPVNTAPAFARTNQPKP